MRIAIAIAVGGVLLGGSGAWAQTAPAAAAKQDKHDVRKGAAPKGALECYELVADLSRMGTAKAVPVESTNAQNARAVRMFHLCAHGKFAAAQNMHDLILTDPAIRKHHDDKKGKAGATPAAAEPRKP
jgi:hypothetical protein